jgi:N-acetylglutamate synthase-like GNAT family acetyltransferase
MKIQFRAAEISDLPVIQQCVEQAYRPYVAHLGVEPAPLHTDYADHIQKGNVLVVQSPEREFVGILLSYLDGQSLVVDNVAILPSYQRKGALVEICAEAVRLAREAGAETIRTFTNQKLTRNIAMYEKLGLSVSRIVEMPDRVAVHMEFSLRHLHGDSPSLANRIMRYRR